MTQLGKQSDVSSIVKLTMTENRYYSLTSLPGTYQELCQKNLTIFSRK